MKLAISKYTLVPMTNLHVNRAVKRGGDYEVYKSHISATTVVYGSRPSQLLHSIVKESTYEWPSDGFMVTPAVPENNLSLGSEIDTRIYNLIAPMGGILQNAVFADKSSTYTTTSTFSGPVKRVISLAVAVGELKRDEVESERKKGRKGGEKKKKKDEDEISLNWRKAQRNPRELMKKIRRAVFITLKKQCPNNLSYYLPKKQTIQDVVKEVMPGHTGNLPGLLEIEERINERFRSKSKPPDILKNWKNISEQILSDLNLYMYGWDHYSTTRTRTGKLSIYGKGSNDPLPNFGTVEYIRPYTRFFGYMICEEVRQQKLEQRFSRILHFGTFASTNETAIHLEKFRALDTEEVRDERTIALQYPLSMLPDDLEVTQIIERTERYLVVKGKYTGNALVTEEGCIPIDDYYFMNITGSPTKIPVNRWSK